MYYSVIYTAVVPKDERVKDYAPPKSQMKKLWSLTECHWEDVDGDGKLHAKHRKWCAFLDHDQFDEFVSWCALYAQEIETMGMLGAPGIDVIGWVPAISFDRESLEGLGYGNAYVCPVPDRIINGKQKNPMTEKQWDRIKELMLQKYGY